jgi:hypothetical protein
MRVPVLPPFAFAVASLLPGGSVRAAPPEGPPPGDGTVVLELFTSQGCSSCPSAEKILQMLGKDETVRDRLVPLAFHVDYWNRLGWQDPFSAAAWTERQSAYGSAFGLESNYTPQLVVNGRAQINGANGAALVAELNAELAREPKTRVVLSARRADRVVEVEVAAEVREELAARKLEVMVALYESGLVTPIGAGENGGRTLENDFVVRRFSSAFTFEAKPGARKEKKLSLKLDSDWKAEHLGVAAFLQDPSTMRIYGAAALRAVP